MSERWAKTLIPAAAAAFGLMNTASAAPVTRYVPQDTVIRVKLQDELSSKTARTGDLFTAKLDDRDRSGFPEGTRFEGSVIDARRASKTQPGVLGIKVHRAIMPDGSVVAVNGTLAGLSDEDVRRTGSGRLEARGGRSSKGKFETKWVGYGAAGGAVLGTIFGGSTLKGALLGALGGAAYSYLNKDKGKKGGYHDVDLSRGTEFGVRVHHQVAFRDPGRYRYAAYEDDNDYRDREDRDAPKYRDRDDRDDRDYRDRDDRDNRDRTDRDGPRYRDRDDRNDRDRRDRDDRDDRDPAPERDFSR